MDNFEQRPDHDWVYFACVIGGRKSDEAEGGRGLFYPTVCCTYPAFQSKKLEHVLGCGHVIQTLDAAACADNCLVVDWGYDWRTRFGWTFVCSICRDELPPGELRPGYRGCSYVREFEWNEDPRLDDASRRRLYRIRDLAVGNRPRRAIGATEPSRLAQQGQQGQLTRQQHERLWIPEMPFINDARPMERLRPEQEQAGFRMLNDRRAPLRAIEHRKMLQNNEWMKANVKRIMEAWSEQILSAFLLMGMRGPVTPEMLLDPARERRRKALLAQGQLPTAEDWCQAFEQIVWSMVPNRINYNNLTQYGPQSSQRPLGRVQPVGHSRDGRPVGRLITQSGVPAGPSQDLGQAVKMSGRQPASALSTGVRPVSGPPMGVQATSAQPMSGPPVAMQLMRGRPSGVPPMSGPPMIGTPIGGPAKPMLANPPGGPPIGTQPLDAPPPNFRPPGPPPMDMRPAGTQPMGARPLENQPTPIMSEGRNAKVQIPRARPLQPTNTPIAQGTPSGPNPGPPPPRSAAANPVHIPLQPTSAPIAQAAPSGPRPVPIPPGSTVDNPLHIPSDLEDSDRPRKRRSTISDPSSIPMAPVPSQRPVPRPELPTSGRRSTVSDQFAGLEEPMLELHFAPRPFGVSTEARSSGLQQGAIAREQGSRSHPQIHQPRQSAPVEIDEDDSDNFSDTTEQEDVNAVTRTPGPGTGEELLRLMRDWAIRYSGDSGAAPPDTNTQPQATSSRRISVQVPGQRLPSRSQRSGPERIGALMRSAATPFARQSPVHIGYTPSSEEGDDDDDGADEEIYREKPPHIRALEAAAAAEADVGEGSYQTSSSSNATAARTESARGSRLETVDEHPASGQLQLPGERQPSVTTAVGDRLGSRSRYADIEMIDIAVRQSAAGPPVSSLRETNRPGYGERQGGRPNNQRDSLAETMRSGPPVQKRERASTGGAMNRRTRSLSDRERSPERSRRARASTTAVDGTGDIEDLGSRFRQRSPQRSRRDA